MDTKRKNKKLRLRNCPELSEQFRAFSEFFKPYRKYI